MVFQNCANNELLNSSALLLDQQVYFYIIQSMQNRQGKIKSTHIPSIHRSFRIGGSMAEENQVKSFNQSKINKSLAPSQPHRIQLPLFFNTPSRITPEQRKAVNKTADQVNRSVYQQKVDNGIYITVQRRLKDYQMLAFGCRRAGKIRQQGRSYYSMGVLYDNIHQYKKAIDCYSKFLDVCKSINDNHGQALAYNCIGVDYQLLAEKDSIHIPKAIEYHQFHEQLADINGKFLASINLGLCYDSLNDTKNSIFWFQNALKYSIQMSNLSGQSLAMGNIGRIGTKNLSENKDKMKIFVQKYMNLAKQMNDQKGQMQGCLKLGTISSTKKNFEQGRENFKKALDLAQALGDKQIFNEAKFGFAVVNAEKGMENYLYSHKFNMAKNL